MKMMCQKIDTWVFFWLVHIFRISKFLATLVGFIYNPPTNIFNVCDNLATWHIDG